MENKKVKNAKKCEIGDVKFDSRLEMFMYSEMVKRGIKFTMKEVIELMPKFKYLSENVRNIRIIPDYFITDYNHIVDTKGFFLSTSTLKYKMLKYILHTQPNPPKIFILKNQKEVLQYLNSLCILD